MEFSRPPGAAFAAPRRVFTAPTQSSTQPHASSSRSVGGSVDTLYDHPSVKIVAFTAGPRPIIGPRPGLAPQDVEPGTLSWSSQFERTIAVGRCPKVDYNAGIQELTVQARFESIAPPDRSPF
jgi:hypothetical protein